MQTGPVSLLSPSCHPGRPGVCRTRNVTGRDSRRQALPARHLSPSGAEAAFQAPVSAGAPPPAVGPGQSRAPPRLPGHPAHTSVSPCATRKVSRQEGSLWSFPAHPAPTSFSLLLIAEPKPVGGPPALGPAPPALGPRRLPFLPRVRLACLLSALTVCTSSGTRPPWNNSCDKAPQQHTPSCPEVHGGDGISGAGCWPLRRARGPGVGDAPRL